MNIKYTLFKNDDFYYLLIGTWFDANKAGFLHLKHGIFTACEMDQITRKKQAIFDFNNHFRIYEFHAEEKIMLIPCFYILQNQIQIFLKDV